MVGFGGESDILKSRCSWLPLEFYKCQTNFGKHESIHASRAPQREIKLIFRSSSFDHR